MILGVGLKQVHSKLSTSHTSQEKRSPYSNIEKVAKLESIFVGVRAFNHITNQDVLLTAVFLCFCSLPEH